MLKLSKKITAAFLTGAMLFSTGIPCTANAIQFEEQTSEMDSFIDEAIHSAMDLNDFDNGFYSISELIPVYNFETKEICNYKLFVLSDDAAVGEMDIWDCGNQNYISAFKKVTDYNINSFIGKRDSICYGIFGGKMWLCANNNSFYAVNTDEEDAEEKTPLYRIDPEGIKGKDRIDDIGLEKNVLERDICLPERIDVSSKPFTISNEMEYNKEDINASDIHICNDTLKTKKGDINPKTLSITRVPNETSDYGHDKDLCWTACIAMRVNFKNRNNPKYIKKTARGVYEELKEYFNEEIYSDNQTIIDGYDYYEIDVAGGKIAINYQALWNTLQADQPVDVVVNGKTNPKKGDPKNVAHQMLINGIEKKDKSLSFTIIDPNKRNNNGKITAAVSGKDINTIMKMYLKTLPYTDTWSYSNGTTIDYNNIQRTYYTANTI